MRSCGQRHSSSHWYMVCCTARCGIDDADTITVRTVRRFSDVGLMIAEPDPATAPPNGPATPRPTGNSETCVAASACHTARCSQSEKTPCNTKGQHKAHKYRLPICLCMCVSIYICLCVCYLFTYTSCMHASTHASIHTCIYSYIHRS